jgi:hypothetical protein
MPAEMVIWLFRINITEKPLYILIYYMFFKNIMIENNSQSLRLIACPEITYINMY